MFAQKVEKNQNFSPEITLSLNQTTVGFKHDRTGFGIGAYNAFFNQKRCNLIVGIEYNWNSQLRKYTSFEFDSKFIYTKNYISIPVYFRVNIGKKVKFLIEPGLFFDPIVYGRIKYTNTNAATGKIDVITNKVNFYKPDFGISGGIGMRIPLKEYEILLKCDYKWGMRYIFDFSSSRIFNQNPWLSIYNQYFRFTVGFKTNFNSKEKKK